MIGGDRPVDDHDDVERWSAPFARLYALTSRDPWSNRIVVERVAPGPDDVVVDVGSGSGAAVRRAARAGARAIGVDPSEAMVTDAARRHADRPGASFVLGHAADLPLADDEATAAWAVATFHHWPDRRAGLAEVRRVLRPGGQLVLGERWLRWTGRGHGLDTVAAEDTARLLLDLGYHDVGIARQRLWVSTLLLVHARA